MSLEQEEQGEKGKTAKRTVETRPISCRTKDEAEQSVLELVNKGSSYREVAQIAFVIDGKTRRFNISQISRIVNEKHGGVLEDEIGDTASKVFALFQQGKTPVEVVMEMRLPPFKAKELYAQYNELKGLDTNLQNHIIKQLVIIRDRLFAKEKGVWMCPYCDKDLTYAQGNQTSGYVCTNCKVFIESGVLVPRPIPKNMELFQPTTGEDAR